MTNGGTVTATSLTGLNGGTAMIARECASCGKRITERFLLKALDLFWHEDCLKCGCCDCRLGEVGSTLYTKANLILCKRDYLRYFTKSNCTLEFKSKISKLFSQSEESYIKLGPIPQKKLIDFTCRFEESSTSVTRYIVARYIIWY